MKLRRKFRSVIATSIRAFIAERRAIGLKFKNEEDALALLDRFLLQQGVHDLKAITPAVLDDFLDSRARSSARSYNCLLSDLRRLFNWMTIQGTIKISPLRAKPRRGGRTRIPVIISVAQARELLQAASQLADQPPWVGRARTYRMMFAVLYGLGLRVGEAVRLQWRDVDWSRSIFIVRQTKFGKSRIVPFGPKMTRELQAYEKWQVGFHGPVPPDTPIFFVHRSRRPLDIHAVSEVFHKIGATCTWERMVGAGRARVHDLRHSCAVCTLLRWYRDGVDPAQRLMHLSTFLGHVSPSSTAWYLKMTPELLDAANARFEAFAGLALDGGAQ